MLICHSVALEAEVYSTAACNDNLTWLKLLCTLLGLVFQFNIEFERKVAKFI